MNTEMNDLKKQKRLSKKLIVPLILILVFVMGLSFAVVNQTYQGKKKFILTANSLSLMLDESKTLNDILVEDSIPVTDEVGLTYPIYTFSLVNKGPSLAGYTIYIVEDAQENKTPTSAIRYHYTRDKENISVTKNMSETLTNNGKYILETGKIGAGETYEYTFQMWLGLQAENDAMNTKYSIHLEIEAEDMSNIASEKLFSESNLGENCKTYNDGVDTFLVGQCSKNYVWYSGKLWRVVLKNNETGAVKMITDNSITSIPYNSANIATFENSYADQ